jgi:hypothetical protein
MSKLGSIVSLMLNNIRTLHTVLPGSIPWMRLDYEYYTLMILVQLERALHNVLTLAQLVPEKTQLRSTVKLTAIISNVRSRNTP